MTPSFLTIKALDSDTGIMRCGTSLADAAGKCGSNCTKYADCVVVGEACFSELGTCASPTSSGVSLLFLMLYMK